MKERDIFLAALEIANRDERDAFLSEVCAEPGQKEQLQALLDAEAKLGTFLESPARPPERSGVDEAPGTVIGAYKLLEQIGEGGMGVVWMAEQSHPVRRKVALKIIKPGMDSRQVIARFEAERQALALMEHPNIAHVLDGGTTASGRPYFVMELVRGVPITEFCDRNRLDPEARLKLFVTVCLAIQHAHQKGIIHRDIKPSNVMVTLNDGQPVAKVIDFGIAKATEQRLTERTCFTAYGEMIGTPAYMSPEQAEMAAVDVDTRSDIYSLGVLLYELMTGTTPIDDARLRAAGFSEIQRLIREVTPPRPSARLSTLGEKATILADNRGTDRRRLVRLLAGDLDWIMMKALEKERDRRCASAGEFAADIERFLRREGVLARPPSTMYRVRTFVRRHRAAASAASIAVVTLVAGTAIATWQAVVATRAETKAVDAQRVAQSNLYHSLVEGAAALRRARGMGYRAQVFKRLQQAFQLDTPDKDTDRLRQEAAACLGDFVGLDPITWEGLPADIRDIALTPDGRQMAIALESGTIQVRDVSTGGVVAQLRESADGFGFDSANRWLVTAVVRGTIKVWRDYGTVAAPAVQTINIHADIVGMTRNGRFAIGYSQQKDGAFLSVWDIARQEVKARLNVPTGVPRGAVRVSDDGRWLAQAYAHEGVLHALVWNAPDPQPKKIVFARTNQNTKALSISPDGSLLACMYGDSGLILLDLREGGPRPLIRDDEVLTACFSPDGRFLLYGTLGGRVRLWNATNHQEVASLTHLGNFVASSVNFSADGNTFAKPVGNIGASSVNFSADGNTFATAVRSSHSIRIWNMAGSGEKLVLPGHDRGVSCVAFSPDGKVVASGSKDQFVKLWDAATGRLLRSLPRFQSSVQSIGFSPDGRLLATGEFGPTPHPLQIWDLATLQAVAPVDDELGQRAYGVAFSPDGKILAACGNGLTLWRVGKGEQGAENTPRASFQRMGHLPGLRSLYLCISPDGKLLAWVDQEISIALWDLANGREVPFLGPPLSVGWNNLAFYPDSNHLTFGTTRGQVETWDTRSGKRVSSFGQSGHVASSRDGRWLANGDPALWTFPTGSRVFSLPHESSAIWGLALSPNAERLAIGQADGELLIWNVRKIQDQLTEIGLAWHPEAHPPKPREARPFDPSPPLEKQHQVMDYLARGRRLAWAGRLSEAEAAFRAALKLKSDDPIAHENLGMCMYDQGRYHETEAELSAAIELRPQHAWFWVLRGWSCAEMGQWEKAAADFAKATECSEPNVEAWYSRAILHLRDGELDSYREVCSDMLRRFGTGATWTCTLSPNCGADPARIVNLAETLRAESPRNLWRVNQLGAALYRAGRFEDAVKVLAEATELDVGRYPTDMVLTEFYLAMAHHRLGHADLARRWLERAKQETEEALKPPSETVGKPGNTGGVIPPNWHRKLTFQLLRREAEELMQGPGPKIGK